MKRHTLSPRHEAPFRPSSLVARPSSLQSGFTLVEMLVAVALVLLMMVLFAQVFQGATKAMSQQKGMAENDQKARRLTTLLKGDFATRTFVKPLPFPPGGDTTLVDMSVRRGYFMITENDPNNNTDDSIQFTVELKDENYFAGRARFLKSPADIDNGDGTIDLGSSPMTTESLSPSQYLQPYLPNQPEFDEGLPSTNSTGISRNAEVCYFLRNGNLYRRVLLIRDCYSELSRDTEPALPTGDYVINSMTPAQSMVMNATTDAPRFWRDFDYSAFHQPNPSQVRFHTVGSLDNGPGRPTQTLSTTPPISYPVSLGIPHLRFGSTIIEGTGGSAVVGSGAPREYLNAGPPASNYIGRFTLQETSHSDFLYPGSIRGGGDPFNSSTSLTLVANTGLVSPFHDETSRRGEDIVMTNVHEFDIQVYDDGLTVGGMPDPKFVQLGHAKQDNTSPTGYYNTARRLNTSYGPYSNTYDTWHVALGSQPPYRPFTGTGAIGEGLPLKAIQITVRYFDVSSNQMRQLTLIQSLAN